MEAQKIRDVMSYFYAKREARRREYEGAIDVDGNVYNQAYKITEEAVKDGLVIKEATQSFLKEIAYNIPDNKDDSFVALEMMRWYKAKKEAVRIATRIDAEDIKREYRHHCGADAHPEEKQKRIEELVLKYCAFGVEMYIARRDSLHKVNSQQIRDLQQNMNSTYMMSNKTESPSYDKMVKTLDNICSGKVKEDKGGLEALKEKLGAFVRR